MTGVVNNQIIKRVDVYKSLYKTLDVSRFASVTFQLSISDLTMEFVGSDMKLYMCKGQTGIAKGGTE
jgi:hypothetical protein